MKSVLGLFIIGVLLSLFGYYVGQLGSAEATAENMSGLSVQIPRYKEIESSLAQREEALIAKQEELNDLKKRLDHERQEISTKLKELGSLRDEIMVHQQNNERLGEEIFTRLVKTYDAMDARRSADVIAMMDDELAVDLLLKMRERNVAQVFAAMDPARAMQLSKKVAARRPAGRAVQKGRP